MKAVPRFLHRRAWWLLLLLAWGILVGASLRFQLQDLSHQSLEVAAEGARNMFRMVVLIREWNAEHGGVYVPASPSLQPNPYLEHPRRDLTTTDGQRLTMVNPAFMTRLLAELAAESGGPSFHITSLNPIRPKNAPDAWERQALEGFQNGGAKELIAVTDSVDGEAQLRYMAPLFVTEPCLECHRKQGYRLGDIRGGISVSQPFAPVVAAAAAGRRQTVMAHGLVFLLVAAGGGWLLELLRRRWQGLADNIAALESAQADLERTNRSLAQARDAAEAASRAKGAFLSNMSHELRTPLNAVMGFTHLLRMDEPDRRRQEMLTHVDTASRQLLTMIDDVLDLSRMESGELHLVAAPFNLDGLLAKLVARLEADATAKGLRCHLERDPALPSRLVGDATRIAQLLGQYVDNAVKFSAAGEILLTARQTASFATGIRLRLEVRDQGVGISAEQQQRLFSAFEQLDMSSTRRYGGAGLGLAVCRRLADLMGGEVGVVSAPGEGSLFWFEVTLPAGEPQPPASRVPEPDGSAPGADLQGILAALCELLSEDNLEAASLWREHQEQLSMLLGDQAAIVGQEINAFRFDAALEALRLATGDSLPCSPGG